MTKSPTSFIGPASRTYFSQRLRLHYVDWGNKDAPPLLLVHGGRDHCRNWDWVAEALRDDYHVIAPDLRGHGDSQWMVGGTYMINDYVYDIAQLIHQLDLAPLKILAHSFGGAISLRYAGVYPDTVQKLIAIEGLGPSPKMLAERAETAPHERLSGWVDQMRKLSSRMPRRYESLDAAFKRMQEENPHLSPERARHLTEHGMNQNEDGTWSWKFDNYVRAFPPDQWPAEETRALWGRITSPVMLVRGTESWASDPVKDGRIEAFQNATSVNIDGAGHWVHHDKLEEFLPLARDFLKD
ncbi:alpha/beta fold hydrolase [Pyruvatibacter mobilis]|uniref:alpha/beta fold hydrolase n=1 Tax=Pyruvatibacter mobilis TaxID=1712261 RepID=UPI003C7C4DA7